MKEFFVLLIIIFSLLVACAQEETEYRTVEDEYAVYSAIIEQVFTPEIEGILVKKTKENETLHRRFSIEGCLELLTLQIHDFNPEGWENAVMLDNWNIEKDFDIPHYKIMLIENDEFDKFFEGRKSGFKAFEEFFLKYSGYSVIVTFSRVAFHPYRNEAIVLVDFLSGADSGWGNYIYLKKVEGEWKIIDYVRQWIT